MSFNSHQLSMSRVFNVEKSIAAEFYPYKISQALIDGKSPSEIKNIIGANHWVFNTVVTDCKTDKEICLDQNIILAQFYIDNMSKLNNATWVSLRDPAPFDGEKTVKSYKENGRVDAKPHNNQGNIIGRIYFLESETFTSRTPLNSLKYWITTAPSKLVDGRKNNDNYSFTKNLLVCFALFIFMSVLGILANLIQTKRNKERIRYDSSTKALKREYKLQKLEKDKISSVNKQLLDDKSKLVLDLQYLETEKNNIILEQEFMRHESVKLEDKQRQLVNDNFTLEKKYNFILNYTMANKFQLESEFTAPLRNQLQKLDLIIEGLSRRNHYDTKDALHDLRKAKLLKLTEDELKNQSRIHDLQEQLIQSRQTIKWTAENIERLTNLSMQTCNIYEVIESFLDNRPPSARLEYVEVGFERQSDKFLTIEANPYHIQAIIKNALYNALTELEDVFLMDYFDNPEDFHGKVAISCGEYEEDEDYVFIKVADNAGGVPEAFIDKLYESHTKKNPYVESL